MLYRVRFCRGSGGLVSDDYYVLIHPSARKRVGLRLNILIIVAQAVINIDSCLGAVVGPLVIGAFTEADEVNGWKKFYVSQPPSYLHIYEQ